ARARRGRIVDREDLVLDPGPVQRQIPRPATGDSRLEGAARADLDDRALHRGERRVTARDVVLQLVVRGRLEQAAHVGVEGGVFADVVQQPEARVEALVIACQVTQRAGGGVEVAHV